VVWRWGRAVGEGRFPIHRTSDMGVLDNASVVHVIRLGRTRVHFRVLAVVPPPPKARNPECTGRTPEVIPHPDQRNMISAAVHTEIPNPGTSFRRARREVFAPMRNIVIMRTTKRKHYVFVVVPEPSLAGMGAMHCPQSRGDGRRGVKGRGAGTGGGGVFVLV
jgi:hypothetical protein